jgi:hypothetical protein
MIFLKIAGCNNLRRLKPKYLGWQESLEKLKKLVGPNIPDA